MSRRQRLADGLPSAASVPLVVAVTALAGAVSAGAPLSVALLGSVGGLLLATLAATHGP